MQYSEKLKDPRWQKLRLQIFERDLWTCQHCYDAENTLNAHHLYYESRKEPWEYPLEAFKTLCATCHEAETKNRPIAELVLLEALKRRGFSAFCVSALAEGFAVMPMVHAEAVVATSIKASLVSEPIQNLLEDLSFLGDLREEAVAEIRQTVRSYFTRRCAEHKESEPLSTQK